MENEILQEKTHRFGHASSTRDLYILALRNFLLIVVTLGIYKFWAKTKMRQFFWNFSSFNGEAFVYTGTPIELLKGAVLAFLIIFSFSGFGYYLMLVMPEYLELYSILVSVIFSLLGFLALFAALRYKLSRTKWNSIQFGMTGSSFRYASLAMGNYLLCFLTLGLFFPFARHNLANYKLNNIWIGSEAITYSGSGKDMLRHFLISYILTIPTLGLVWFLYFASEKHYFATHTHFQQARFDANFYAVDLFLLWITNLILFLFTFGLAMPYIFQRVIKFNLERFTLVGIVDFKAISAKPSKISALGEGLLDQLDPAAF